MCDLYGSTLVSPADLICCALGLWDLVSMLGQGRIQDADVCSMVQHCVEHCPFLMCVALATQTTKHDIHMFPKPHL